MKRGFASFPLMKVSELRLLLKMIKQSKVVIKVN